MMANDRPVCDRCGVEQAHFRFCPGCQLFVCSACWEKDGAVCLTCARPNLPGPGQVPLAIRGTIGQRSLGVSASASRLGQALTGPTSEVAPPAERAGTPPAPLASRRSRLASALLIAFATSALLLVALYGGPVLSRLLADDGGAPPPSPPVFASPEGAVQGQRSSPKPARRTYLVRAGDTLRTIALAAYGDEERWIAIYRANRRTISDPDVLKVGTTLTIP